MIEIFFYVTVGILAGVMGALVGIGGGVITVPALLFFFSFLKFPQQHLMHIAIGTSLASMVINTLSATYFHHRKKSVVWKAVGQMLPGIILGSFFGSYAGKELSSHFLEIIFGVFSCVIGISFLKSVTNSTEEHALPSFYAFFIIGAAVATIANLLGLGGGFFILPILFYFRFDHKKAIGTSSATSFFISLGGAIGYLLSSEEILPMQGCLGYIYIPAFVSISLSSLIASFFGVRLAHTLPVNVIRRVFAVTIITVGLSMILSH